MLTARQKATHWVKRFTYHLGYLLNPFVLPEERVYGRMLALVGINQTALIDFRYEGGKSMGWTCSEALPPITLCRSDVHAVHWFEVVVYVSDSL